MAKRKLTPPDKSSWNFGTKLSYAILNATRFPELPSEPKTGKNYEYWPEDAVTAEGIPTYGCIRLGKENKLMISFCGGGVSVNEYTAARPGKLGGPEPNFYAVETISADMLLHFGTNGRGKKNPFRDWSILFLPYTTGDFHCGNSNFPYTNLNGKPAVLHHHGYQNYRSLLAKIRQLVPNPDQLIVTGFSAGAFGTSLLADDVISQFPQCQDVTVIVDSAIMHHDWQRVAREVWGAPEEIAARLTGTELVSDSLIALHQKRPEVKIMYCCSKRDFALTQWVGFLEEDGNWTPTEHTGDRFQAHLREMVKRLEKHIPNLAVFIFDVPDKTFPEAKLTTHCLCGSSAAFTVTAGDVTCANWMARGVNGEPLKLGLERLEC